MEFTKIKDALEYIGGMSSPSKMPCYAYSIPAQECKLGKLMRKIKGSVCSKCYALKGRYVFPNVIAALYRRFATLYKPFWCEAFAFVINNRKMGFFRWHDAGDIQYEDTTDFRHIRNIARVAELCPNTRFWLPSREVAIWTAYFNDGGTLPSNLNLRISGTMIEGKAPIGFAKKYNCVVSSVSENPDEINCVAPKQGGECKDCRACWNKDVFNVVYQKH